MKTEYTEKVDIYSFGLIIIEISYCFIDRAHRKNCFDAFKNEEIYSNESVSDVFEHWIPMAQKMVNEKPELRPTADEVSRNCHSMLLKKFEFVELINDRTESYPCMGNYDVQILECIKHGSEKRAIKCIASMIANMRSNEIPALNCEDADLNYIVKYYGSWIEEKEKLIGTPFERPKSWPERFTAIEFELCTGNLVN